MRGQEVLALVPGGDTSAWREASEIATEENIIYTGRQYERVVCAASPKYDDFWTAAKAVYKAEAIVRDGGELIVCAPGVKCFSYTHESAIRQVGYHPAAWFLADPERYAGISGTVLSHLSLARCEGEFTPAGFRHRIAITLATGIARDVCEAANMGYADCEAIDIEAERSNADTFVIEDAGDILYKLTKDDV